MDIIKNMNIYITLHFIELMLIISRENNWSINELITYIF